MMKSIGMYDERLNSDEKATYFSLVKSAMGTEQTHRNEAV